MEITTPKFYTVKVEKEEIETINACINTLEKMLEELDSFDCHSMRDIFGKKIGYYDIKGMIDTLDGIKHVYQINKEI